MAERIVKFVLTIKLYHKGQLSDISQNMKKNIPLPDRSSQWVPVRLCYSWIQELTDLITSHQANRSCFHFVTAAVTQVKSWSPTSNHLELGSLCIQWKEKNKQENPQTANWGYVWELKDLVNSVNRTEELRVFETFQGSSTFISKDCLEFALKQKKTCREVLTDLVWRNSAEKL